MANSKKNISIGYGLCCISLVLKKHGVGYRRFSHSNFSKLPRAKAVDKLSQICLHNAETLLRHIEFCALNSISRYRMPSDIFPLLTHPKLKISLDELKNFPEIKKNIKTLRQGGKIRKSRAFHASVTIYCVGFREMRCGARSSRRHKPQRSNT